MQRVRERDEVSRIELVTRCERKRKEMRERRKREGKKERRREKGVTN